MPARISIRGEHLVDEHGRVWLPHGASVSGDAKVPTGLPTHSPDTAAFFDHRDISFVGRPFPLAEAEQHLARIAALGLSVIRLVVVWEALEHAGPGQYDDEYIEYIAALIDTLPRHGLRCMIDHHQDVWSRLCGGSGAPGWTLELAGFDIRALHASGAAFQHALEPDHPGGVWPAGYQKLAGASMATLFWSGDDHAPLRAVPRAKHADWRNVFGGSDPDAQVGIGTFLQRSLFAAFARLLRRVAHSGAVIGLEPLNEPHRGYLELHSMDGWNADTDLRIASVPTALQSFALGAGYPQRVAHFKQSFPIPSKIDRYETVTPPPNGAWLHDSEGCIWRQHDVWSWSDTRRKAIAMRSGYFESKPGSTRRLDFYEDCLRPFVRDFAKVAHDIRPDWLIFAGSVPNEYAPSWPKVSQPPNLVMGEHFYDLFTLFYKYFGNVAINVQGISRGMSLLRACHLGNRSTKRLYRLQIGNLLRHATAATAGPTFFGEVGLPWDINRKSEDPSWPERALDAVASAFEALAVPFAWWCYASSNTRAHGDGWLGEDFSFYSTDGPRTDDQLFDSVRGIDAIQRTHLVFVAGIPITSSFDMYTLDFSCRIAEPAKDVPLASRTTEIFLPNRRYDRRELVITLSDGRYELQPAAQRLLWTHVTSAPGAEHWLKLSVAGPPPRQRPPDIDLRGSPVITLTLVAVGLAALIAVLATQMR